VSEHPLAALVCRRQGLSVSEFLAQVAPAPLSPAQVLVGTAKGKGQTATVAGARLPGWTGGTGFFLSDEHSYVIAAGPRGQRPPPAWQAVEVVGRWQVDEWGGGILQFEAMRVL
jgi:hypothetical protein